MDTRKKRLLNESTSLLLEIGSNIRKWRTLKGLKQEWMADQLGVSKVAYSKIENGQTDIPLRRLFNIAAVLQLKIHLIFADPLEIILQMG